MVRCEIWVILPATIDYEQSMQMFKNSGNEAFTFVAKYNDTFQLYKMNQYGGIVDGKIEAVFKSDEKAKVSIDSIWFSILLTIHQVEQPQGNPGFVGVQAKPTQAVASGFQ